MRRAVRPLIAVIVLAISLARAHAAPDAGVPDAAPSCGNGIVDTGERCDTAIASGAGACPTEAFCESLLPGSHGGGCAFKLVGSGCEANCVAQNYDCDNGTGHGSGSGSGSPPPDDGSCNTSGGTGWLGAIAAAALVVALRRRRVHIE